MIEITFERTSAEAQKTNGGRTVMANIYEQDETRFNQRNWIGLLMDTNIHALMDRVSQEVVKHDSLSTQGH